MMDEPVSASQRSRALGRGGASNHDRQDEQKTAIRGLVKGDGASEKICGAIRERAANDGGEVKEYLDDVLSVLAETEFDDAPGQRRKLNKLHLDVYVAVLTIVGEGTVKDKLAEGCVSALLSHMDSFPHGVVQELTELVAESCCDGRGATAMELLPRCMASLASRPEERYNGHEGEVLPAMQYRTLMMRHVMEQDWPQANVERNVTVLRGIPMEQDLLSMLVKKVLGHCRRSELQEVPSLAYQLLLLSDKGHKRQVLHGLVNHFNREESKAAKAALPEQSQARHVMGTVIMYINLTIKQDADLGVEWIKSLKSESHLTPFSAALTLSVAKIPRFEASALEFLKGMVLKAYRNRERLQASTWASSLPLQLACGAEEVEEALMRAVHNSPFGLELIVDGLVQLAFSLVDCAQGSGFLAPAKSQEQAAALGMRMVAAIFEAHTLSREKILEQVQKSIAAAKGEEQCTPYVSLLALLASSNPHTVGEHIPRLKEMWYFPFMGPRTAVGLLAALEPLLVASARPELMDFLVLVMRKSMFARELRARLVAVKGLLRLILFQMRGGGGGAGGESAHSAHSDPFGGGASCSQMPGCSQMPFADVGASAGRGLLDELMGFLRRCLTQQAAVREALYEGVPALLDADPSSHEAVCELLQPHLMQFYEPNASLEAPLRLENCVAEAGGGGVRTVEPLPHLLRCVRRVMASAPPGEGDDDMEADGGDPPPASASLRGHMRALYDRMQACTPEHFELDGSCFTQADMHLTRNLEHARLLLGVVEVLVERCVEEGDDYRPLVSFHKRLSEQAAVKKSKDKAPLSGPPKKKARGGGEAGGAGGAAAAEGGGGSLDARPTMLTAMCVTKLLAAVAGGGAGAATEEGDEGTQAGDVGKTGLRLFALKSCSRLLADLKGQDPREEDPREISFAAPPESEGEGAGPPCSRQQQQLRLMSGALFGAARAVVLAAAEGKVSRAAAAGGSGGGGAAKEKKSKDPAEALPMLALKCLDQMAKMCQDCPAAAGVLSQWPVPEAGIAGDGAGGDAGAGDDAGVVLSRLPHLQHMLKRLLDGGCRKEVEQLSGTITHLAGLVPAGSRGPVGHWAEKLCASHKVEQSGVVKALLVLALRTQPPTRDLALSAELAAEAASLVSQDDDDYDDYSDVVLASDKYPVISVRTRQAAVAAVLSHAEGALDEVEWVLGTMAALGEEGGGPRAAAIRTARPQVEDGVYLRLEAVVKTLARFKDLAGVLKAGAPAESFLKGATRAFKALALASRLCIAPKSTTQAIPSERFRKLVDLVVGTLTPQVYDFLGKMNQAGEPGENETAASRAKLAKLRREGRTLPNLIFQIEDLEKQLLQLGKACGGNINLLRHAKRSTARDFKLSIKSHGDESP